MGEAEADKFRVKKREVERRIVRDQSGLAEELEQLIDDLGEAWLAGQVRQRQAVNSCGVLRNVTLRIDQRVEMPSRRQVVHQFQRRYLDHSVAEMRFQTCGFRVEQDGAIHARTSLITLLSAFSEV